MVKQPLLQSIRVLLIIKHNLYREALGMALSREDPSFEIVGQCGNSVEGAETFRQCNPTIVIMDASMRPASFAELTHQLLCLDTHAAIIAMTNQYDQLRADRLMQEGAIGLITRNMLPKSMLTLIREIANIPSQLCAESKT